MPIDIVPSNWIPNLSNGTHTIIFNTKEHASASLPELTDAEANATTGDSRSIIFAITEAFYTAWLALAVADRPTKLTLSRNTSEDSSGNLVRDYSIRVYLDPNDALSVVPEV